ncbi:CdaR family protein [Ferdinandcohnia quinoae]|uniref:CdaR family protein n=1 Tax=Fredinandcohnia quinoae TaxID=2918902 RepID=A0AAW5EDI6_9BACI|nr:CdaR family protein [Fredinandcohnia sp. SECRCQ15]MCH1627967.1 CdaR family protein [Fredinandcohnia sp. SECRCQ15]
MDKLMDNRWVIRIIALLLALLLFTSVAFENKSTPNTPGGWSITSDYKDTLTEIPVNTYYDEKNLVVSGVPQFVNVAIEGPSGVTKKAGLQKEIEVYADLTDLAIGTHKVKLQYRNISDKIQVKIEPAEITVVIQEKVTKEFSVEVDFVNKNQLEDGYKTEQPVVKPNVVKITGAKEEIDKIALVKAVVDLKGVKDTLIQESRVAVYDKNQNVLSVSVEPSVVEVTVPILSPSKTLSLNVKQKGELAEGLSLLEISSLPKEVTIYGPKEVIDSITSLEDIMVDVDKITENTTLEVSVPVPKGVTKVSPEKVEIKINVEKEEKRSLSDIPIRSNGLGDQFEIAFLDPSTGILDLEIMGAPSILNGISPTDFDLYVDVTNLEIGEHDVDIKVNGPQNITWVLPVEKAKVSISEIE